MAKARNSTIQDFRKAIDALEDHDLAEKLYDQITEEEVIEESDKRKLQILLQTKVTELKQTEHDEKFANGDKEGAAAAIAHKPDLDKDGKPIPPQPLRSPSEIKAANLERGQKPMHVPDGCHIVELSDRELRELQAEEALLPAKKRKLVGVRPVKPETKESPTTSYRAILKKMVLVIALLFGIQSSGFAALSSDDIAVFTNSSRTAGWKVDVNGDLVPITTNTYDIGTTSLYPAQICLGGSCKSSWGSVISPWEDGGTTTFLTSAPTKFIATHSSGDWFSTGFTVGTGDFTFANGGKLDGDTANEIRLIENSDTLKIGFSGDDITLDTTDGGVIFALTDATDGKVLFKTNNDTDDYMIVSTASNVPTISTLGTSNLIIAPDGGDTQVTGTLAVSGVATAAGVTTSSTITLQNSETIVNSTNGTVTVGNATNPILNVLDAGTSDSDAYLSLSADAAADNGDVWRLNSDGTTNSLLFENNTSGSQATVLTLAGTGLLTTTGDVTVAGTTPLVTIGDGGDEDIGIQLNSDTNDFYVTSENTLDDFMIGYGAVIGTTPILTITDAGVATSTGSTDGDLTVYGAGTTNSDAYLRLVGDAGADAADRWQLFNDSSAGDLLVQNDSGVAGTYVTKLHLDSTGVAVLHGTTDGALDIYADGTTASDAYLRLIGDAQADAADSFQFFYDSSAGTLEMGIDSTAAATYIAKATLDSTGAFVVQGSEATAGSISIWADNGDDAADKVKYSVADSGALTMTTGSVTGYTVSAAGLVNHVESTTLGSAITDVTTFTGKIAGATPMSFDGTTADTVYTILAITDPTSSSKTVTVPATTGAVMLSALTTNDVDAANSVTGISNGLIFEGSSADGFETSLVPTNVGADATITLPTITGTLHGSGAAVALTPGATPTLTVVAGRQVFTYQPADNTDATFNASAGGSAGDTMTFIFTTDAAGSGDEVMTFGTNMYSTGTLTMANLAADIYVVSFVSNGTAWVETGRTAVQTT